MTKKYSQLENLNDEQKNTIMEEFEDVIDKLKDFDFAKIISVIKFIPNIIKMTYESRQNRIKKQAHEKKHHPITPIRGQIYNAYLGENIGSELCGNHLVVIIQNKRGNIYGERVNVIPIEGDGKKINPNYQIPLTNDDLEYGKIDKDPSRIIVTDILTIDKARLGIRIGKIKESKMQDIDKMLKKQLELS